MTGPVSFYVWSQITERMMAGFDHEIKDDSIGNDISHAQVFWLLHKYRLCKDQPKAL